MTHGNWVSVFQQLCNQAVDGSMFEYGAKTLTEGLHIPFRQYAGKYVLLVNVATFWGLTFQYLGTQRFRFAF